jgi:hypothetical protein
LRFDLGDVLHLDVRLVGERLPGELALFKQCVVLVGRNPSFDNDLGSEAKVR